MSESGESGGRVRLVETEQDDVERDDVDHPKRPLARRPHEEEPGAVSTEFALLLVLVALVIIAAVTAFGISVSDLFDRGTTGVGGV